MSFEPLNRKRILLLYFDPRGFFRMRLQQVFIIFINSSVHLYIAPCKNITNKIENKLLVYNLEFPKRLIFLLWLSPVRHSPDFANLGSYVLHFYALCQPQIYHRVSKYTYY